MSIHLDNFRMVYTLNYPGEEDSEYDDIDPKFNLLKILTWVPVIAHIAIFIFSITKGKEVLGCLFNSDASSSDRTLALAGVSRCAIAFFATPLLLPIDLVGTAVKLYIDYKIRQNENFGVLL